MCELKKLLPPRADVFFTVPVYCSRHLQTPAGRHITWQDICCMWEEEYMHITKRSSASITAVVLKFKTDPGDKIENL